MSESGTGASSSSSLAAGEAGEAGVVGEVDESGCGSCCESGSGPASHSTDRGNRFCLSPSIFSEVVGSGARSGVCLRVRSGSSGFNATPEHEGRMAFGSMFSLFSSGSIFSLFSSVSRQGGQGDTPESSKSGKIQDSDFARSVEVLLVRLESSEDPEVNGRDEELVRPSSLSSSINTPALGASRMLSEAGLCRSSLVACVASSKYVVLM
ncbi:hypothetical protein E2C01_001994 [Portunus trituberculatus]|uniref:Uncharacterized protein n=1 Tax=Portunus trituberculatus TaxID=210409 RepID=A0A5B7CP54_PORTR|nr:hypothetical protein [Portunus trituberculatus]